MIIARDGGVCAAFFIGREDASAAGTGTLGREAAIASARRELERAGLSAQPLEVEAYESETGWMVFVRADEKPPEREAYFLFEGADELLDALAILPGAAVHIFPRGGGFVLRLTSQDGGYLKRAAAIFSEFGRRFEASPLYFMHMREQGAPLR